MQLILRRNGQQLVAALTEGRRHQCCARQVVDRILVGDLLRQGCAGSLGQELVVRHDGREAEALVHIPLDGVDHTVLVDAAGQAAEQGRCHIVRVALDAGGQGQQLLGIQDIAQHSVGPQQARNDAGRRGTQTACHGDGVGLHDPERRDLLPHLVEQAFGRAVDQIGLVAGDAGPVRCRDVQFLALFKGHGIVQGHRQAQGIEA